MTARVDPRVIDTLARFNRRGDHRKRCHCRISLPFRSAFIPILALPIAVIASFIPMYYLQVSSNICLWVDSRWRLVSRDAAIVMVENGYRHCPKPAVRAAGPEPRNLSQRERRKFSRRRKASRSALFFSL